MSKKQERLNSLLNLVNVKGRISVKELAAVFEVAELTIRRDVQVLEQQGFVQNVRGIVFANKTDGEGKIYDLNDAGTENFGTKDAIGAYASRRELEPFGPGRA